MFRIKICGITSTEDAAAVAAAGADAVGLNFYPKSPRFITPDMAEAIVDTLPANVVKVGLFVNAAVEEVATAFDRLGLDLIQLHGDEPPPYLAALGDRPIMRAMRLGPEGMRPIEAYLAECRKHDCWPRALLIDAYRAGQYGGTGAVADWGTLRDADPAEAHPPLVLAGGLNSVNVSEAIRTVRPAAVDTASGVESEPGRKDRGQVEAFVAAARAAFALL